MRIKKFILVGIDTALSIALAAAGAAGIVLFITGCLLLWLSGSGLQKLEGYFDASS